MMREYLPFFVIGYTESWSQGRRLVPSADIDASIQVSAKNDTGY